MAQTIRVAYFNVQSSLGATSLFKRIIFDWKFYLPHSQKPLRDIKHILNSERIDIAGFVEINEKCLRSNFTDELDYITQGTELTNHQFFSSHKFAGMINQGIGIATKFPIIYKKSYELPGGIEKRSLGEIEIVTKSGKVAVLSTHLSLGKYSRQKQLEYISKRIKQIKTPTILIGDLNAKYESELAALTYNKNLLLLNSPPTYPSWDPKYNLGRILHSANLIPVGCRAYTKNKVSDHIPIIADFKIS